MEAKAENRTTGGVELAITAHDKQQASSIPGGLGSTRRFSILRAIACAVRSGLGLMKDVDTLPCFVMRREQGSGGLQ